MSYNKLFTKLLPKEVGVNTIAYQYLDKNDPKTVNIDFPLIVKPVRLGSSIGISVVKQASELAYALDVAFEFDTAVLIEPFIKALKSTT